MTLRRRNAMMWYLTKAVKSFLRFCSRLWAVISIKKRIQRFFERNILFDVPDRLKKVFLREVFDKKRLESGEFCKICKKKNAIISFRIRKRLEFEIDKFSYWEDLIRRISTIYAFFAIATIMIVIFKTYKGLECVTNLLRWISVLNSVFSFVFVSIASVFLTVANLTGEFVRKFYLKKALRLVELALDSEDSKIDN